MSHGVVITGIGVVSPIGADRETFWRSCLEGRSGVRALEGEWARETGLTSRIAAVVKDLDPVAAGLEIRLTRNLDRVTVFALAAAGEALADADLPVVPNAARRGQMLVGGVDPWRLATVIGSGVGGLTSLEISHATWRATRNKTTVKRYSLPMLIPNAPAAQVAIRFGARGECKALSTACAAGTMALGDAWRMIRSGEADVVLAGGAEGVAEDHDAYALMGFERLKTLSSRNDEPQRASRPFDRQRDGFVLGEGAAVMVLERAEHAAARGATAYARLAGYASNCDAHAMMQLDETGAPIVAVMTAALQAAGVDRERVDLVSAHGTSTLLNDRTESRALRTLYAEKADQIPVTALKSMTGHCIAASGAMETAAVCLGFRHGMITPTINYDEPDPECNVAVVGNRPLNQRPTVALKPSYGFGGHNACLVLTTPDEPGLP
jgi:3-oxoacyl-[acyl-carrier-protein] synthase II